MLYAHDGAAAGHLFIGFNHGVSHVFQGRIGDHIHPEIWYQPGNMLQLGEQLGLAVLPSGELWVAGRYAVGLQPWNPEPHFQWVDGHFIYAFTADSADHELNVPVGYRENNTGAAVTPDGVLWLSRMGGGLASWDPRTGSYSAIRKWPQVPSDLIDVQADPTGQLWVVTSGGQLWRFDPGTGALSQFGGVSGVRRIYVDTRVAPRALYAATSSGLAVIRVP
jgi:sugar lactone lactonase YvrE